ncbi:MAG: hypothetical protein HYT13_02035 [Candidatus Liptonbacteria bacterium]|nr:hypothetical protein [Candidatus Liptonbacteria bacterium]
MKFFTYTVIGIVVIAVVAGFFVVGSPKDERARRFDGERVGNLQYIQSQVIEYWQNKSKLPQNLTALNDSTRNVVIPTDPETGKEYGYEIKGPLQFALCATFATVTNIVEQERLAKPIPTGPYGPILGGDVWSHDVGRVCFDRTIDKDFFSKRPPVGY